MVSRTRRSQAGSTSASVRSRRTSDTCSKSLVSPAAQRPSGSPHAAAWFDSTSSLRSDSLASRVGLGTLTQEIQAAIDDLRPLRGRRRAVFVVTVLPLVGRGLRVTPWRIFPFLLASERGDVQITP